MATTYSIYFESNYGETQDYAFFTQPPIVSPAPADGKVYSNVWISKRLRGNGGNTTIKWTTTFYAWSGLAPTAIEPGVVISDGHGVAVTLGTTIPGSTRDLRNDQNSPYFEDKERFTAKSGCFEIDTITDFTREDNFLIGMGAIDADGRMTPAATISAPRNAKVNFQPIVKFYVAAYAAKQGTSFNYESISNEAGGIDFTSAAAKGKYGAIVKLDQYGAFTTTYATQQVYAETVPLLEEQAARGHSGNIWADVSLIKRQIAEIFDLFKDFKLQAYTGTLKYFGQGVVIWNLVWPAMQNLLQAANYHVANFDLNGNVLRIFFSRAATNLNQAEEDWNDSYKALPNLALAVWANKGIETQMLVDKKAVAREFLAAQGLNGVQEEITA